MGEGYISIDGLVKFYKNVSGRDVTLTVTL